MERRGRLDWNGGNIGCIAGLSREGVTKQEGSWSDLRTLAYAARPDKAGSVSSAATITQPESAPDTTVVAPQSYQSLEQSGAIVSGQVRCRDTHGSN